MTFIASPKIGSSHGMRNELNFSSEVALDGSSWHTWLRHEVELAPHRQPAVWEEREVAGSRQGFFALLIHSEGYGTALKKLLWWPVPPSLIQSQKSGNASDSDTELRWSEPGVACEPILPTPTMMRTDGTGWTRRRLGLRLGSSQGKHLHILPTPVGYPGASKRSPCHIDESRIDPRTMGFRATTEGGGKRRRTALTQRARSPLAPDAKHCSRRVHC
jgi:hypothetical protein